MFVNARAAIQPRLLRMGCVTGRCKVGRLLYESKRIAVSHHARNQLPTVQGLSKETFRGNIYDR